MADAFACPRVGDEAYGFRRSKGQFTSEVDYPRSFRESASVMRRLIALLVLVVGLLGAAGPTLACAAASSDCCPSGAPGRCQEQQPSEGMAQASVCCVSLAASVQIASFERAKHLQGHENSTLDSFLPASSPELFQPAQRWTEPPRIHGSGPEIDAGLTYLRTGRLRL